MTIWRHSTHLKGKTTLAALGTVLLLGISAGLAAAPPSAKSAGAGSHLSRAAATQAAVTFCRTIGVSVGAPVSADFPATEPHSFLAPTYWQPCWRARFAQGAEVDVSDPGGVITDFDDFSHSESTAALNQPAGKAISREAALAKAAAVLSAAHVRDSLAPPTADESNTTSPPTRFDHQWIVSRTRQAQGTPFADQQVTVLIQAETGQVVGLGVTFPTPFPAPLKPSLTTTQATGLAQKALIYESENRTAYRSVGTDRLIWITPHTHLVLARVNGVVARPPVRQTERALPPRLAWQCAFRDAQTDIADITIDAVTGQALPDGFSFMDR